MIQLLARILVSSYTNLLTGLWSGNGGGGQYSGGGGSGNIGLALVSALWDDTEIKQRAKIKKTQTFFGPKYLNFIMAAEDGL